MISSLHRRPALLGALLSTQAQGTYYGTYVGPSYDMLSKLHGDVNTLIMSRSNFQSELDALYARISSMDEQLAKLDSTDETQWTATAQDLQNTLRDFERRVKTAKNAQSLTVTLTAGVVAFGTTWAFTKRIPRVRRSYYAAGAMLLGGGAAQLWWRNRG